MLKKIVRIRHAVLLLGLGVAALSAQAAAERDGSHDFDFNFGKWKTSIRRIENPFGAERKTVEMSGTVTVKPVWNGRAQMEEIEVDGRPGGHWQGATLFLYNPTSHQWTQTFMNSENPVLSTLTGSFVNGRGELYAQDVVKGQAVLVRGTWSDISKDAHRYEEAYSRDGGRSWETVFAARLERISP